MHAPPQSRISDATSFHSLKGCSALEVPLSNIDNVYTGHHLLHGCSCWALALTHSSVTQYLAAVHSAAACCRCHRCRHQKRNPCTGGVALKQGSNISQSTGHNMQANGYSAEQCSGQVLVEVDSRWVGRKQKAVQCAHARCQP